MQVAGTFTTNLVKAAPVKWDRAIVESGLKSQAVIVNSGIANACTGEEGMNYCAETAKEAAKVLGIDEKSVLVGSTRRNTRSSVSYGSCKSRDPGTGIIEKNWN